MAIKNLERCLQRLNNISKMDLTSKMKQATTIVHAQAKNLAPVNKRPGGGYLAGSIHMEVNTTKDKIFGRVYTNAEYASYVEFGTGIKGNGTYPYSIEGLNLSYKDKSWKGYIPDVGWRYITGQVAQPFMYPALKNNEKYIRDLLKSEVKSKLKSGGK